MLVTDKVDGCILEAGADSRFSPKSPGPSNSARRSGWAISSSAPNDADRKTYILVKGKLIEMPDGLMFMVPTKLAPTVMSPLFSDAVQSSHGARMVSSAAQSNRRRNGRRFRRSATTVPRWSIAWPTRCSPALYGGEASQLERARRAPRFAEMEAKHGSLAAPCSLPARLPWHARQKAKPRPLFTSLQEGMQQMVDALVAALDASALKTRNTAVQAISARSRRLGGLRRAADSTSSTRVIVALPAHAAAA